MLSLPEIAAALRGRINGPRVLAPGPGHSHHDRSLSVRLSDTAADGFVVHSYAGDDWRTCRDHVADALGLASDRWRTASPPDPVEIARRAEARRRTDRAARADAERNRRRAGLWWREACHPAGTIVETYLRDERCLPWEAVEHAAGRVLRFHPCCPFEKGTVPAMVALIRCVRTGRPVGIHRTALTPDGKKIGRMVYGSATAAAIMLDDAADVATGLTVGEGIETCLAARLLGLKPVWSLISSSNIKVFPVLPGIEALTVLAEVDTAPNRPSATACDQVGTRWHAAGRAVDIVTPRVGKDMNDVLRMGGGACR